MSIITLISDFGTKDFSVSAIKGNLHGLIGKPTIIDITHEINPYDIVETAFILKAAYPNFPENSIHLIGVDSGYSEIHKHIVARLNNHFFIGTDNGVFSLLANKDEFDTIIEIEHPKAKESNFPMLDVFVDVAAQIIFNEKLENLGTPISRLTQWTSNQPNLADKNEIIGHIVYIDRYGNLVTDIKQNFFTSFQKNRKFEINASSAKIDIIHSHYNAFVNYENNSDLRQKVGKALAVFNSLNLLEIALFKTNPNHGGSAASLLGLHVGDSIRIRFED